MGHGPYAGFVSLQQLEGNISRVVLQVEGGRDLTARKAKSKHHLPKCMPALTKQKRCNSVEIWKYRERPMIKLGIMITNTSIFTYGRTYRPGGHVGMQTSSCAMIFVKSASSRRACPMNFIVGFRSNLLGELLTEQSRRCCRFVCQFDRRRTGHRKATG
jgi:hypothetical protein